MEYLIVEKSLLDFTNLFLPNPYKNNDKIVSSSKANITEENISLELKFKKIDERGNYLLKEIEKQI